MNKTLLCGAAVADITPTPDLLPMPRFGNSQFGGIIDPLKVRAIALGDGTTTLLLISFDLGGAPDPAANLPAIAERVGIPVENILFVGTHAHAAPMVGRGRMPMQAGPVDPRVAEIREKYEKLVYTAMFDAVDRAVASMRPARAGHAKGACYINVNRNKDYVIEGPDGTKRKICFIGNNNEGPVDHTLFAMKFEDLDGNPIAFFINYPLHNVVMHDNICFDGSMGISSDIGGNVSQFMERKFPGAVAMWTSGAAGDVNPIMMNDHYLVDPDTGKFTTIPDSNTAFLKQLAAYHYDDVMLTLDKIDRMSELCSLSAAVDWSLTPGRDVQLKDPANPYAGTIEIINEDTKPYDIRVHLMRIGDVALLGISGELYTTHAQHIREVSPMSNTVIVTHDASALSGAGYIYDDDGIARGAMHYNRSRIRPGYVRDSLAKVTLDLFEQLL